MPAELRAVFAPHCPACTLTFTAGEFMALVEAPSDGRFRARTAPDLQRRLCRCGSIIVACVDPRVALASRATEALAIGREQEARELIGEAFFPMNRTAARRSSRG